MIAGGRELAHKINVECYRLNYQLANEFNLSSLNSVLRRQVTLPANVAHGEESWFAALP